jgi:hypothetical protein
MKKCNKCLEYKPYTDFSKDKSKPDGLNIYCRSCIKLKQDQYKKDGRCPRCGNIVKHTTKKTCENCRNIWGYDFQLVKSEDVPSCNPEHLVPGTDKDNARDSIGQPRKKNPFKGQLITVWGETKPFGEWMCDQRKNKELSGNTIRGRLKKMSPEDALTKPLYRKYLTQEQRSNRIQLRLLKEHKNNQKFQIASTIRQLYTEGESIDDLQEFFKLKRQLMLNIIGKRSWYNPSIESYIPFDYIRKKRLIPPDNVELNKYGFYIDKKFGIPWNNGYFSGYAYLTHGRCINSGKFDTPEEAARKINYIYIENGYDPPYKFE